ncbi:MAG TPA: ribosome maturation factor RimM [Pseudohongiella sp.]|nr:ribosome maturation factor RimM [Pseudohongiella sp.]
MQDNAASELVSLGRIGAPYGIKGWFKLVSFTQPRDNILQYRQFTGSLNGRLRELEMDEAKPHGKGLIAHIRGFDTPEDIRLLTGTELMVPLSELPDPGEDDYYWHQLIGLLVQNQSGVLLGRVDSLLETGANDVLVVKPCEGSVDKHQRLIPWLPDQVVIKVDLASRQILVDWEADYLI